MNEFEIYKAEVREKWGNTEAYKEYTEKTKNYSKEKLSSLSDAMNAILSEFALCMKNGANPDSPEVQSLVETLQKHITDNCYNCTNDILAGLGQMYVCDERFRNNIDKNADGTAQFISDAIRIYCK